MRRVTHAGYARCVSRDFEDDDHTTFFSVEREDGDVVLSRAAYQLHTFGMMNSIRDGHPGFVSDEYLSAIAAESDLTAAELCVAELWERVPGGYNILDPKILLFAVEADEAMRRDSGTTGD